LAQVNERRGGKNLSLWTEAVSTHLKKGGPDPRGESRIHGDVKRKRAKKRSRVCSTKRSDSEESK